MAAFSKVGMTVNQPPIKFDSWTLDTYGPLHASIGSDIQQVNFHVDVRGDHATLIRNIEAHGTALLKNSNKTLHCGTPATPQFRTSQPCAITLLSSFILPAPRSSLAGIQGTTQPFWLASFTNGLVLT